MDFKELKDRLDAGGRVTDREALALFGSDDIFSIGRLASHVSDKRHKKLVYFIKNMHINPSNICVNRCKFCAFSKNEGEPGAYEMGMDEIIDRVRAVKDSVSEFHIVGGLHPRMGLEFYSDLFRAVKAEAPNVYIKALTAVEIDYLTNTSGKSVSKVLGILKDSGLDSMPGGGAEIFRPGVRNRLCPEKIPAGRWLKIKETAHRLGIRTTATMLFGHVESYADRVDHLARLRRLQDNTGGFLAFIPLPFHPKNTRISGTKPISGLDILKTIAISRIYLNNFEHVKAYWVMTGEKLAQVALCFGANDLDGTVIDERITHAAGGESARAMTVEEIVHVIKKAGKTPVERDTLYNKRKLLNK